MAIAIGEVAETLLPQLLAGAAKGGSAAAKPPAQHNFNQISQQNGQALQQQLKAHADTAKNMVAALGGADDKDDA